MTRAKAFAKINLGLVVGPLRANGRHELVTVLQRIELHDVISIDASDRLEVEGFAHDTIVHSALDELARAAGVSPTWSVRIDKQIPVAAGLGGGSTDAATTLLLANAALSRPLELDELHRIAAQVGADVPFFLHPGTQLATGDGTDLVPASIPSDFHVVLVVPHAVTKASTASVFAAFDERHGHVGFTERAAAFRAALAAGATTSRDLAKLPPNDLASSAIADELVAAGAFRADVSGAGPTVYGLFESAEVAVRAADTLADVGRTYTTRPVDAGDLVAVAR